MKLTLKAPPLDHFEEIVILKGSHSATPYWVSYEKRDRLAIQYLFTDSCAYAQPYPNHKDWEKLIGLSLHLLTNHRNSIMVSYRYNPDSKRIELGVYTHIAGERIIQKTRTGSEVFVDCKIGAGAKIVFDFMNKGDYAQNNIAVTITTPDQYGFTEVNFPIDINRKTRVINPYIGKDGREALQDTYFWRKLIV